MSKKIGALLLILTLNHCIHAVRGEVWTNEDKKTHIIYLLLGAIQHDQQLFSFTLPTQQAYNDEDIIAYEEDPEFIAYKRIVHTWQEPALLHAFAWVDAKNLYHIVKVADMREEQVYEGFDVATRDGQSVLLDKQFLRSLDNEPWRDTQPEGAYGPYISPLKRLWSKGYDQDGKRLFDDQGKKI